MEIDIKGQMRAVRLANIIIKPFDYNPVSGMIKVYKNIEFDIHYDSADLELTEELKQKYFSPYFENNYKQIHNYQALQTREDLTTYPVTYVILANSIFHSRHEPELVGSIFGMPVGSISKPIKGREYVYVIEVTAKDDAITPDDVKQIQTKQEVQKGAAAYAIIRNERGVTKGAAYKVLKAKANVKDNLSDIDY